MRLASAFLTDSVLKAEENKNGRNYWWTYISEITDRLGLTSRAVEVPDLLNKLPGISHLFIGGTENELPVDELEDWVHSGGVLIGSNCSGLDALFGIESDSLVRQTKGEFSISGEILLKDSPFTADIHSPLHPSAPLLAASDIQLVAAKDCNVIAECNKKPVITARQFGEGWAFYFGFDLGQTFWVIQQGRPVDNDYDGDGFWRTADMVVTRGYPQDIPYTDELIFLLQNMVGVISIPLIHQLPHNGGEIPDFLVYFTGDDEAASDVQIPAAEFMTDRDLPYHINCMAENGKFGLDREKIDRLQQLETELSIHYNYVSDVPSPFQFHESDTKSQTEAFVQYFGFTPVCPVAHLLRWTGWAEPAIWMSNAGVKGDNSYIHCAADIINPVNVVGFAFGTSFPFHFWLDSNSSNSRLDFLELPITGFEMGYVDDTTDFAAIDKTLDLARHYQSTMSFFYHPIYIAHFPACREAIDYLKSRLELVEYDAMLMTPDTLIEWWHCRSESEISDVLLENGKLTFRVSTPAQNGIVVKVPLGQHSKVETDMPHRVVEKFGRKWILMAVTSGETKIELQLAADS